MEHLDTLDMEMFGLLVRKERKRKHIDNLQQFSYYVFSRTGYRIPKDTLQRIEAGKQEPTLNALCAISLALFDMLPAFGKKRAGLDAIGMSAPDTWLDLQEHPDRWPGHMEPGDGESWE